MKNRPENAWTSAEKKVNMPVLLGLMAAGFIGNYLGYEVFFSIHFIFGSIFSMLALQLFGLRYGLLAGLIVSSSTWPLWNHPYAIIIFTSEMLAVALLSRRRMGFVLADAVFWLCLGAPLVYIFYHFFMHLAPANVIVTILKQALNGIANTLLARLIFMVVSARNGRHSFLFREVVFNILALFILVPSLVLPAIHSRVELTDTDRSARTALQLAGKRIPLAVAEWLQSHHEKIIHLASMAAIQPVSYMQQLIEQTKRDEPDFLRIGLLDAKATTIAFAPLVDELGQKNIGRNFADRPFVPVLRNTLRPLLAEVVMGRVGVPKPAVSEVAPVVKGGRFAGYVIGVLKLENVRDMIGLYLKAPSLPDAGYILLDNNKKVIASSRDELKTMDSFFRAPGEIEKIEPGLMQWLPMRSENMSLSDRWKHAVYFNETRIGGLAEWTLVLEQPMAPFQKRMYRHYVDELTMVFCIFLAALLVAELVSRHMVQTLTDLQLLSSEIPKQLSSGKMLSWPTSTITETEHLIHNIRDMSQVIALQFYKIREMNAELEERVVERTSQLQGSEKKYRTLFREMMPGCAMHQIICDSEGRPSDYLTLEVNDAFESALNVKRDQVIGRRTSEFMPADELAEWLGIFGPVALGGSSVRYETFSRLNRKYFEGSAFNTGPGRFAVTFSDVTERKQAEDSLRKSEERLKRAQQVAKVGNWEWNIETNELTWSEEVYRLYGVDPHVEKPSYDIVLKTLAPECRERFTSSIEDALRQGKRFEGEYRIIALDGTVRHTHTAGEVLRDAEGQPLSMFGVVQDVTERKLAEEALRKSEERYRAIVDNQVDFVNRYLPGGILTFVNDSLARYMRMKPEALIGKSFFPFIREDDRPDVIMAIESLSRQKPYVVMENRAVLPDGTERWHQWTHSALFDADSKVVEYQSAGRDVTERRESEEKIRQLAAEQRIILDSIATGIMYVKNRKALWANPAFYYMYGYEQGEFQGADTARLYADIADYERVGREGYARLSTGETYSIEVRAERKGGKIFWVSLVGRAIDPGKPTDGSIWIFQEITERKNAEAAMRERTSQLENLTRELEKMVEDEIAMRVKNEQLLVQQSKLAAMGQMLGAIAHQWRQPLNALGLMVQNLKDAHSYGELDEEYLQETVRKSMDQIQHMSKTIDDFRNFFQPVKERSAFDTMQAVGFVLSLLSAQLAANDIEFALTCHTHGKTFTDIEKIVPCAKKTIDGHRNEFEHVILNLINNAREAVQERRDHGVPDRGRLLFDFYNRENSIIITVTDNGGGIDAKILDRVFEPYFTTKDPTKGTGLGLYMCKVIIEDHFRGKLTVENTGDGAAFTIKLPQAS